MFCRHCGSETAPVAVVCVKCGAPVEAAAPRVEPPPPPVASAHAYAAPAYGPAPKSRLVAGLLGVFFGAFGVHRFYLGHVEIGLMQLLLAVVGGVATCGLGYGVAHLWGLIEGIVILCGGIDHDGYGRPLAA